MNWKVLGGGLALALPLFWVLAQGFRFDPRALPDALTGDPAPAFSLQSLDGYAVSLADLRGDPVVINFWASWCIPCAQEHPYLVRLAQKYKEQGVVFLGVLYSDTEPKARTFLKKHGTSYPTLLDPDQRTAIDYGVAGVPETYVLNKQGEIVKKFTGPMNPQSLSALLDSLL